MFLRAWPVSAVQLKWSAKVKGVIARCRRSVSETMGDGKQRNTSGGVKKTGEVWVGSLSRPKPPHCRSAAASCHLLFRYFAPFLKEAKGAKAVVEQKKKRGGRGVGE